MLSELVQDLVGVPCKLDGRSIQTGFDCYGLVREIAKRTGYATPDYTNPSGDTSFLSVIRDRGPDEYYVPLDKPEPGCVVSFRFRFPYTSHIGVVLDDCNQFIHVMRNRNVCIEKLNSLFWKDRITGFYKWTKSL